jgi:hypothetical protein
VETNTTYCSFTTVSSTPDPPTFPFVPERALSWIPQASLQLATATDGCPASAAAPACTGAPADASAFSSVTGYVFSRASTLSGASIYAAQFAPAPAATRVVLTPSAPIDAIIVDASQLQRYAAGLNFEFLPYFSRLGVSAVDEVLVMAAGMAGDYYLLVTPARGSDGQVIRSASDSTHAVAAEGSLTLTASVAGASIDPALAPAIAGATDSQLYVTSPSKTLVRPHTHVHPS